VLKTVVHRTLTRSVSRTQQYAVCSQGMILRVVVVVSMRRIVQSLGKSKTLLLITLFSVFASVAITLTFHYLQQDYSAILVSMSLAVFIPSVVAPLASWPLLSLLMKVDKLEREMRELATYDSLTGLLNRRAFFNSASMFCEFAEREGMPISFVILDLDNFKSINDSYGHQAGDSVLIAFAKSVKSVVRKSDIVGRIGGEEFAFLLPDTSESAAVEFTERLHHVIRHSVVSYDHHSISYTVSMGIVSLVPDRSDDIDLIYKNADQSLYIAKEEGRNRTELFAG